MQRITVSIDDDIALAARRDVEAGRAPSLSAWVSDAMRRKALGRIRLELELDELRAAEPYGPEEVAFAAKVLELDEELVRDLLATPIRGDRSARA